jgi:tetratricopeptide (TPR) repeat protein
LAHAEEGTDGQRVALHRVLDHYLFGAHAAARHFWPRGRPLRLPDRRTEVIDVQLGDLAQASAWCEAEQAVLCAAVNCAANFGFAIHAWQLAWAIETIPEQWRRWQDQITAGEIALAAARQTADLTGQAYAQRQLGKALTVGGRHAEAGERLQQAQVLFCRLGDRVNQADTELAHAQILIVLNDPARALARSWHALKLFRAEGDSTGHAGALNHLGRSHVMLGRYELGVAACEQALEVARQSDDPYIGFIRSSTLDSKGIAHHRLGHYDAAIAAYQQALDVLHDIEEFWLMAFPLDHLGDTYYATGDPQAARDSWKQAISVLDHSRLSGADEIRQKLHDLVASS